MRPRQQYKTQLLRSHQWEPCSPTSCFLLREKCHLETTIYKGQNVILQRFWGSHCFTQQLSIGNLLNARRHYSGGCHSEQDKVPGSLVIPLAWISPWQDRETFSLGAESLSLLHRFLIWPWCSSLSSSVRMHNATEQWTLRNLLLCKGACEKFSQSSE